VNAATLKLAEICSRSIKTAHIVIKKTDLNSSLNSFFKKAGKTFPGSVRSDNIKFQIDRALSLLNRSEQFPEKVSARLQKSKRIPMRKIRFGTPPEPVKKPARFRTFFPGE
jgi:hypothetical protein